MKNNETNIYPIKDDFDLKLFQETFNHWIKSFKEIIIDKEFEKGNGKNEIEETKDKLSFRFTVKWGVDIERVDGYRYEGEYGVDDEDSDELKKEKEHNKKYGVEITETFPFPDFDSGVPQKDEDTKGNI
jgi:hypothetical protein